MLCFNLLFEIIGIFLLWFNGMKFAISGEELTVIECLNQAIEMGLSTKRLQKPLQFTA